MGTAFELARAIEFGNGLKVPEGTPLSTIYEMQDGKYACFAHVWNARVPLTIEKTDMRFKTMGAKNE